MDIESTGPSFAGETYSLTCTVSLPQQLRDTPTIQWTNSNGTEIENDLSNVTVSRPSPLVVVLTFAPLHISHDDVYRCVASVDVAEAGVFLINDSTHNITVHSKSLRVLFWKWYTNTSILFDFLVGLDVYNGGSKY